MELMVEVVEKLQNTLSFHSQDSNFQSFLFVVLSLDEILLCDHFNESYLFFNILQN